jgi:hypothetical protein
MLKIPVVVIMAVGLLLAPAAVRADATEAAKPAGIEGEPLKERVFVVKDYRYEPGTAGEDLDLGQSLCGTRCNALSIDYLNITMPGGWRMTRVASDRNLTVPLDNPFMEGMCICVVDEYLVKVHDLYLSK